MRTIAHRLLLGLLLVATMDNVAISDFLLAPKGPTIRSDVSLSGGRSGQNVKNLTGPPNSAVKGADGRVYVTNDQGQVIFDITEDRVKPVTPGAGFGPKRPPTPEELELIDKVYGRGTQ